VQESPAQLDSRNAGVDVGGGLGFDVQRNHLTIDFLGPGPLVLRHVDAGQIGLGDGEDRVTIDGTATIKAAKSWIDLGAGNDWCTIRAGAYVQGLQIDGGAGKNACKNYFQKRGNQVQIR